MNERRGVTTAAPVGTDRSKPGNGRAAVASRLVLAAILLGTTCLRWRLLAVPLERDEGEYAYMAQLILQGEAPYVAAHNMKLPGAYVAFAGVLSVFGETDVGIRLGLLLVNLVTIVLVHRLGRGLLDETTGQVAAAAYAVLSVGSSVLGFTANAEHFVVLPAVAGMALLVRARRTTITIAVAGLLLGLAFVMKQPGAAFVACGAWLVAVRAREDGDAASAASALVAFVAAAAVPFGLTCLTMWLLGAFGPFWFWTMTYAREYVSQIPLAIGLAQLGRVASDIVRSAPLLWVLVLVGLVTPAWDAAARRAFGVLGPFALASVVAVCPGLRFSEHYFILLLPAASLLAGLAVSTLARAAAGRGARLEAAVRVGLPALAVATSLAQDRALLFVDAPDQVARRIYGTNPLAEAREIGRYLAQHTSPAERVGVVGSEPQIYFYADRRAATSYIYTYPLMEPHPFAQAMQDEMVAQLERERPRFLVLVSVDTSWSRRPESSLTLFEWAERTVNESYELVGLAEIPRDGSATYRWDEDARRAPPRTGAFVSVFERRS